MSAEAPIPMEALSPATANTQPLTTTEGISAVVPQSPFTNVAELAPTPTQFLAQQEAMMESPATLSDVLQSVDYVPGAMDTQPVLEGPASVGVLGWQEYVPAPGIIGETSENSDGEEDAQLPAVRAELASIIGEQLEEPVQESTIEVSEFTNESPELTDEIPEVQQLEDVEEPDIEQDEEAVTEEFLTQDTNELDGSVEDTCEQVPSDEDATNVDAETEEEVAKEEVIDEDTEDEEDQSQRQSDQLEDEEPEDKDEQLPPPPVYSFDSAAAGERRRRLEEALESQRDRRTGPIPGSMVVYAIDPSDGSLMSAALKTASSDPSVPKPSTDRSLVDALSLVASAQNVTTDTIYGAVMSSKPVQEGSGDPVSEVEVINVVGPGAYSRRRRGVA